MKHRAFIEGWSAGGANPEGAGRNAGPGGGAHAWDAERMTPGVGSAPSERVQAGVVDLWSIHLQVRDARTATRESTQDLAEEDHEAAMRLRDDALRVPFLAGRRAQRRILSRYVAQPPRHLQLDRSGGRKPVLRHHRDLHFSFTRRGVHALLAVAAVPVGVDLEMSGMPGPVDELMAAIGCDAECRRVAALPAHAQADAVLRCWTAKEACLKAAGWGLALAPGSFDVGPLVADASAPAWTLNLPALHAAGPTAWSVRALQMAAGWSAALATPAQAAGACIAQKCWVA